MCALHHISRNGHYLSRSSCSTTKVQVSQNVGLLNTQLPNLVAYIIILTIVKFLYDDSVAWYFQNICYSVACGCGSCALFTVQNWWQKMHLSRSMITWMKLFYSCDSEYFFNNVTIDLWYKCMMNIFNNCVSLSNLSDRPQDLQLPLWSGKKSCLTGSYLGSFAWQVTSTNELYLLKQRYSSKKNTKIFLSDWFNVIIV